MATWIHEPGHTEAARRRSRSRGAIVLPQPLASIALALRYHRVADGEQDGWLLPRRKPGTDLTAEHLPNRLLGVWFSGAPRPAR